MEEQLIESSLSSDISLPPGNILENISPVTECSDSEFESCKIKIGLHEERTGFEPSIFNYNSIMNKMDNKASNIKETLKENADMLSDKSLLNDLVFHSQEFDCLNENKPKSLPSKDFNELDSNNIGESNINAINRITGVLPHYSLSSTPKKNNSDHTKHVKFILSERNVKNNRQMTIHEHCDSFSIYGTDTVLHRLDEIRNKLNIETTTNNKEDIAPESLPLSRLFVTQLNNQKQRTKDLEEELALNEASLAKTTRELEIVQNRLLRREEQLKETSLQLGKFQNEWQISHKKLLHSLNTYKDKEQKQKDMLDTLNAEKLSLNSELKELQIKCRNYASLQVEAEEMKAQLTLSSKQYNEIHDENYRINAQLLESEEKLSSYSKEVEYLKDNLSKTQQSLEEVSKVKEKLENDFALIQERHKVLIKKTLEEEANKERVEKEKEMFMSELGKLKNESSTTTNNLHHYYQNQVETIVQNRTKELENQLGSLQSEIDKKFYERIEDMKLNQKKELEDIHRRHMEELNSMRLKYEAKVSKLVNEVKLFQKENRLLQKQRQAIVTAVSTIIPHTDLTSVGLVNTETKSKLWNEHPASSLHNAPNFDAQNAIVSPVFSDLTGYKSSKVKDDSQFRVPPLITSTSFSSISEINGEDASLDGRSTVREKRPLLEKREKRKEKSKSRGKTKNNELNTKYMSGKRIYKASEILDSMDSVFSDGTARKIPPQQFLEDVDKTVADLVEEINSMSVIEPGQNVVRETPHHDTSIERDSAQQTLHKIEKVSNFLSNYVKK